MKIDLPITTGAHWKQPIVKAELVDVAPHLCETFAVHRCDEPQVGWKVTHVETGCAVSRVYTTKHMATKKAAIALRDKTQEQIDSFVDKVVKKAPWIADPYAYDIFSAVHEIGG